MYLTKFKEECNMRTVGKKIKIKKASTPKNENEKAEEKAAESEKKE